MLFGGTITSSLIWESTQGRIERDKTEPWLWLSACGTFAQPPHEATDQREADLREGARGSEPCGRGRGRKADQGAKGGAGRRRVPEVRNATGRADAGPHHDHHPLAGSGLDQLHYILQKKLLLLTVASASKDA